MDEARFRYVKLTPITTYTTNSYIEDPNYFEFMPITGGHRRAALSDPRVVTKYSNDPDYDLSSWKFLFVSADIWADKDCDLIMRAISYFDNFSASASCRVSANDCERMLTILTIFKTGSKYSAWTKETSSVLIGYLKLDMVCIYLYQNTSNII